MRSRAVLLDAVAGTDLPARVNVRLGVLEKLDPLPYPLLVLQEGILEAGEM